MMPYDSYTVAFEIAKRLRQEGLLDWAIAIEEAIQFGSTATEILMRLRWQLQQFQLQNLKCDSDTGRLIVELIREMDLQLK